MARKPRIEFAGAVYHVLSRGDRGEAIYQDDEDRLLFLRFLGEVCERTGWLIHAFILMTNHYHILLETPEANLVVGMKWLQGIYTQRFNLRHGLRGHLFQKEGTLLTSVSNSPSRPDPGQLINPELQSAKEELMLQAER